MIKNNGNQQKTELDIDLEEFWKQLMKISKWKSEQMEEEIRNNMQPIKRTTKDKEIEQEQRKVWDLGKLQVGIMKK